jgi:hypothetical protein
MSFRYYNFIGTPGRIFFEGEDAEYCETYDGGQQEFVRDDANMMDMLCHPQSLEMAQADFEAMLARIGKRNREDRGFL